MSSDILLSFATDKRTPFYLYDLDIIQDKTEQIRHNLDGFHLLYSIKANPNKEIIRFFVSKGIGFDVASVNELELASSLGANSSNIYYSSPGKTDDDIARALGKCTIIADSINELFRINRIAALRNEHFNIGIRLNISNSAMQHSTHEVMSGIPTKFGVCYDDLQAIEFSVLHNISITGIHVYFGSQILDKSLILANFHIISNVASLLLPNYDLQFINFGGGFGVPYTSEEKPLDLYSLSHDLLQDNVFQQLRKRGIHMNIELGRFLVAECGYFFSRIVDIKTSFGKKYAILDCGMNSFFRPIMTKDFHEVIQFQTNTHKELITLAGHLCTPIDTYYEDIYMNSPQIDDIIAFKNAGAYGYSMSLINFISHDIPHEFIISSKSIISEEK